MGKRMKISMIVAHGKNYEIGLNNRLLWKIPEDLKKFKELTTGHHILMGRKTFESIGKPLPQRISLVVSNNEMLKDLNTKTLHFCPGIGYAVGYAQSQNETELFVVGGAKIYNEFNGLVDTLYISEVDYDGLADTFIEPIKLDGYKLVEYEHFKKTDLTPAWIFKKYEK